LLGLVGGAAAIVLQSAIVVATNLFFFGRFSLSPCSPAAHQLGVLVVLIPGLGGLIVGLLARFASPAIRGHGIPETMETILVARSRIAPRLAVLKPLATAVSIGSGGPFGAEGPIIQTGGALGSFLGQLWSTTAAERKILVASGGAAAGMAATFNAPLAALLLALELHLFEFRARSILPVGIASAVAAAFRWIMLGPAPLYPVLANHEMTAWELPVSAILGVAAGLLACLLCKGVYLVEDAFERIGLHWTWWPLAGGLAVGLIGLFFPQALGVGSEYMSSITAGEATFAFLLAMLLCKILAWTISLGSGTSGGVLGPLLLMGGSLGGALGYLALWVRPGLGDPGMWAVVSMAAVFAGATRTPLTSVVFALELTHAGGLLVPLLISCLMSDLISVGLLRHSIMTEKIARCGIAICHELELDALGQLTVGQVMSPNVEVVPVSLPLGRLFERMYGGLDRAKHQGYPVTDDAGRLIGIVTRSDLPQFTLREDLGWLVVADVMSTRPVVVAWAEESVRRAAERMIVASVGRLPVVAANDASRIVGILSRSDVLKALARRHDEECRAERLLRADTRSAGPSSQRRAG
jgi:H+/Cl- antiporter ClcA/CBS domain-containing protein